MNEEVLISLRANVQPFRDAMKTAINEIGMGIADMEEFNALIDNANKKQLKGIASNLQSEIKETELIIKDMQRELIIATQSTNFDPRFTTQLKADLRTATAELNLMKKRLATLNASPMNGFQKAMAKINNGFKAIGKSVAKFGKQFLNMMSFSLIFSALGVLRTGLSDAVKLSDSATHNFGAMKNIIAGSLVPVVEWFANTIRKAFVWVAGLIKYLTGFDMIANGINATNKNIDKLGKNAKKSANAIKGSLGGLDEITNIDTASGSGGGSGDTSDDMSVQLGALGELNSMMTEMNSLDFSWAEPIKTVLNFIKENGEVIAIVLGGLALAIGVVNVAMWALSANPIVLTIAAIILGITALIAIIVLCVKHWDEIKEAVMNFVNSAVEWIKEFAGKVGEFFSNIWTGITEFIGNVWDGIVGVFQGIIDWVKNNWKSIVLFIINPFAGVFKYLYDNFEGFRNFVDGIVKSVKDFFGGLFDKVKEKATNAWTSLTTGAKNALQGVKNVFGGIADWFKNIFKKAWEGVKNVFSTGGKIFDGIKDGIVNAFKTVVNGLIKGINKVVAMPFNAINGMLNTIRNVDILGVQPFKGLWKQNPISVPQIPSFDVGTNYVPQDMIAQIHKGERIVPAKYNNDDWTNDGTDMTETNSLLEQLINVVASKNLSIGEDAIGQASVNYILAESRRRGEPII